MGTSNVDDIYELSPLQQGMLLHTLHDGASDMYLGQHLYVIEGGLDVEAMAEAWRRVSAAHPILRTSFHWDGLDKPLQVVHGEVETPAHRDDWSELAEAQQTARLEELLAGERATGFDLTTAPLQRLHLIRLAADRHALAWTHHHLLLDGWSVPIFMNEVMAHYQALTVGGPTPPPVPPFRDYIGWLQHQDLDAAERFWKETLSTARPHPLVALRPPGPRQGTSENERLVVSIAGAIEDGLRAAATRHQVTISTVLHAAWAVVLSRFTGSPEVVLGCVSSGRPPELPEVERMLGMFVNTLPVPVTVPTGGELGPWLGDIQRRYAAIRRFEFSPLADVKKWSGLPGRQLFDSLVVLANYGFTVDPGSSPGRLSVRSQTTTDKVSVPLSLVVTPAPVSELHLLVHRDRFEPGFAEDVRNCLLAVLDALTHAEAVEQVVASAGPRARPAVQAPDVRAVPDGPAVPPATPAEEALAAVYAEVLELVEVDVTTSFFHLGGDSFAAVRAVGRIAGATVMMLAMNPSVRALAAALATATPDAEEVELDTEIAELEAQIAEFERHLAGTAKDAGPAGATAADAPSARSTPRSSSSSTTPGSSTAPLP